MSTTVIERINIICYNDILKNNKSYFNYYIDELSWIDYAHREEIFLCATRHFAKEFFFVKTVLEEPMHFARRDFVMVLKGVLHRQLKQIIRNDTTMTSKAMTSSSIKTAWALAKNFDDHVLLEFYECLVSL